MTNKTFKEFYSQVDPYENKSLELLDEYVSMTEEQLYELFTEEEISVYLESGIILEKKKSLVRKFRVLTKAARRALSRRMKRQMQKSGVKLQRARAMLRAASPARLLQKARKAALKILRKRKIPNYDKLSPSGKETADKRLAKDPKFSHQVAGFAQKQLPLQRKLDAIKVKKARAAKSKGKTNFTVFDASRASKGSKS